MLWRQVGDKAGEATTLNNIGEVYDALGERQKALELYNQALPLRRAVGDKAGEATTLNNIGEVYNALGERQKALELYNQALPLTRAVGDKAEEATALNNIGQVYNALGERQKALELYNQALPLTRAVGDKAGEATALNDIGGVYDVLGEKQKALRIFNQALPLWRAVGDKAGEATTLNNIGGVYNALGEKHKALELYNQALPLWRAVGDKAGEATALNNIGAAYNALGERQKALELYNQALPLWRVVGNRPAEAITLSNIGRIYDVLGEKHKALELYNQALPLARAVGDRTGEARNLNSIGAVYDALGEKHKALKLYNQALPLWRAVSDRDGEASTLNNIGAAYNALGEKQKALDFYNQALSLRRAISDRDGEAITLNNIGAAYDDLGEKQKALLLYNQALPLRRAIGDKAGEATALNNIGKVYSELGEKQKALLLYNQALPLQHAVGDKAGEATTLSNIGLVYLELGEKQKALSLLNQALPLARAVGNKAGEASTLNNIGGVYLELGEKQKALSLLNQALPLTRAVGNKAGEANTLHNLAYLERNRGNFNAALTQIETAIKIIEDLRTKIVSQELRTSYFASVQGYYQFYIDLLMQLHKKDPSKGYNALALHISERSRARVLIELLIEADADIRKGVDPKLLASEERLQQLIDARAKQLQALPDKKETAAAAAKLKKEVESLISQQRELQTQIRTSSPQYANLKYPQTLKLPQIQQQLDRDTLLLQYSLGEERSYLWAVTPNSINSYELPGGKNIEKAANEFKKALHDPTSRSQSPKVATSLSKLILAPVADKLRQKRLVIVADGALQYIPFAALAEPGEREVKEEYQPLIVNHEIVNLPSVTAIATHRQALRGRKLAPKTLAILADPVFSTDDKRVNGKPNNIYNELDLRGQLEQSALQRVVKNLNLRDWGRLPGTRQEAEAILKLVSPFNRSSVFDFDANYNWASNKQLTQYRFVHFATHGFADSTNPDLSGIVLSLVDKAGKPIRGYLRLGDIFNLDLPAELVVLSACETGIGKNFQGEGLVGLTRGLMYAGAKRALVSLWKVSDEETSQLMTQFYKEMLQQGKSPSAALRAAQLKMLQQGNWQNPYYWSAFILQGEWSRS